MAKLQKSNSVYKTPFSASYWRDALSEIKDTKMLVFAALIVALRVTLKMVRIPLAPSLDITPAFLANALGAMVYGPVVGAIGAIVSDVLGVLLRGDTYFLPYVLTEISGTVIFALFFYRQKITPTRVILSRFCICLFVNVLLQTPIDMLYNYVKYGKSTVIILIPRILKNLFMFPIESVVLTLFLGIIQPITYQMKLTHCKVEKLSFTKGQVALLLGLVVVGIGCVTGYLFYHYDNTSLSASYTSAQRVEMNHFIQTVVLDESDQWDDVDTVTIVESAYKEFMGDEITYTAAVYQVDEAALTENIAAAQEEAAAEGKTSNYSAETLWTYSKSPAAKDTSLIRVATVTFVCQESTGDVYNFQVEAVK